LKLDWKSSYRLHKHSTPHSHFSNKVDKKSHVTASFMQHFFRKICGLHKHQICDENIWKLPSCIFHGVSLAVAKEFKIVVKNADLCGKKYVIGTLC